MSTVQALITDARKALDSDRSADQLEALHGQLKATIAERTARLKAICARDGSTFGSGPGPERAKVIADGDVEAVRKLDDEERDLGPELAVLRSLQDNLRQRLDAQRAKEYADGLPQSFAELSELLAAEAKAQAVARKAREGVAAQLKELGAQRHHIVRQNALNGAKLELPAAPAELLTRYMSVNQFRYHRGPERAGWFSPNAGPAELKRVAEVLGLPVPRGDQRAATAA
jgi:hypothetical protein